MEYTGIDNIYFYGTLMGLKKSEIDAKLDDIIGFAEIGDYIGQAVKTYSSGMFARLAFSCAINVEPDILIVDEILSVGDMRFQAKCFNKFKEFKKEGVTILYVGHDVGMMRTFCDRCIWLNNGKVVADGEPVFITSKYTEFMYCDDQSDFTEYKKFEEKKAEVSAASSSQTENGEGTCGDGSADNGVENNAEDGTDTVEQPAGDPVEGVTGDTAPSATSSPVDSDESTPVEKKVNVNPNNGIGIDVENIVAKGSIFPKALAHWGTNVGMITRVDMCDMNGVQKAVYESDERIKLTVYFKDDLSFNHEHLSVAFSIKNKEGTDLIVKTTFDENVDIKEVKSHQLTFEFAPMLATGEYYLVVAIENREKMYPTYFEYVEGVYFFKIYSKKKIFGLFDIKADIEDGIAYD